MEKPILFSGEMVRAILEGRKTQTRRVVKPQLEKRLEHLAGEWFTYYWMSGGLWNDAGKIARCPYGQPGDRLWVRETWKCEEMEPYGEDGVRFQADNEFYTIRNTLEASQKWMEARREGGKWRPSIFMPRWASRITLEVVKVRVERVQEINEEDAKNEGVSAWHDTPSGTTYVPEYKLLWDKLNASRGFGWKVNPWVWVVEFKSVEVCNAS